MNDGCSGIAKLNEQRMDGGKDLHSMIENYKSQVRQYSQYVQGNPDGSPHISSTTPYSKPPTMTVAPSNTSYLGQAGSRTSVNTGLF